jgi:hypothetical protein
MAAQGFRASRRASAYGFAFLSRHPLRSAVSLPFPTRQVLLTMM